MASLAEVFILVIFPAAMIFAAAMDIFTMTISNRISLALVGGFFVLGVLTGLPPETYLDHMGAGAAMLGIAFAMFCFGWIGGGDAKLFATTALWLGWGHLLDYALLLSILGGFLTIALMIGRTIPLPLVAIKFEWIVRLHKPSGDIPYGVALAAAGLIVYPQTLWMASF